MPLILVRDFVRQYSPELLIVGFPQEPHRHQELTAPGVGRVDLVVVDQRHFQIIIPARSIHYAHQREHDAAETLRVARIYARRLLGSGFLARRPSARGRTGGFDGTSPNSYEREQKGRGGFGGFRA
jgi:hypothetical protein